LLGHVQVVRILRPIGQQGRKLRPHRSSPFSRSRACAGPQVDRCPRCFLNGIQNGDGATADSILLSVSHQEQAALSGQKNPRSTVALEIAAHSGTCCELQRLILQSPKLANELCILLRWLCEMWDAMAANPTLLDTAVYNSDWHDHAVPAAVATEKLVDSRSRTSSAVSLRYQGRVLGCAYCPVRGRSASDGMLGSSRLPALARFLDGTNHSFARGRRQQRSRPPSQPGQRIQHAGPPYTPSRRPNIHADTTP
jgi:hypothetical protein